jgi:hypothetical protein
MRVPVRNAIDLMYACLTAGSVFLGVFLDASLLRICKEHLQRIVSAPRYRPVYLRSGRRNRVRC